jgi:hypothetical protein
MKAEELVGRWAFRKRGVVTSPDGHICTSFTSEEHSIFIIKVTDSHIIFRDEFLFKDGDILDRRWLDNNWVDSKKNETKYKKLNYTVRLLERRMKAEELVGRLAIRTDPYLGYDWSYTDEPVFIIKVTKNRIVYRHDNNKIFKGRYTLDKGWLDNNWTDYEDLILAPLPNFKRFIKPNKVIFIQNLWFGLKKKLTVIGKKLHPQKAVINLS